VKEALKSASPLRIPRLTMQWRRIICGLAYSSLGSDVKHGEEGILTKQIQWLMKRFEIVTIGEIPGRDYCNAQNNLGLAYRSLLLNCQECRGKYYKAVRARGGSRKYIPLRDTRARLSMPAVVRMNGRLGAEIELVLLCLALWTKGSDCAWDYLKMQEGNT